MSNSKNSLKKFESEIGKAIEKMNERRQNASENELINELEPKLREVAGDKTTVIKNLPPDNRLVIKTKETRTHQLIRYLNERHEIEVNLLEDTAYGPCPARGDLYTIHPLSE